MVKKLSQNTFLICVLFREEEVDLDVCNLGWPLGGAVWKLLRSDADAQVKKRRWVSVFV